MSGIFLKFITFSPSFNNYALDKDLWVVTPPETQNFTKIKINVYEY
jgi:hypothetical protein